MSVVPSQINLAKTGINVNYAGGVDPLNVTFADRLMAINKGLIVTGNVSLPAGSITASAAMNAATLSIAGNADIGAANVSSIVVRGNTLQVAANATFSKNLTVTQDVNVLRDSIVAGTSTVTGAFTVGVNSATTLGGSLTVAADKPSLLQGTLVVSQNATFNGASVTVAGDEQVNGALKVVGQSTLGNLTTTSNTTTILGGTLSAARDVSFSQGLSVAGNSTLGALTVNQATELKGTLDVATNKATNLGGTLTVVGNNLTKLGGELEVVSGKTTLGGAMNVGGLASFNGGLVVPLGQSAQFNGTLSMASLSASGDLSIGGNSSLSGSLSVGVNKVTSLGGELKVKQNADLEASLTVGGEAKFNNNLIVADGKSTTLTGTLDVVKNANFSQNVTVLGNAEMKSHLVVRGNLTVIGCSTIVNSTVVEVKDQAILLAKDNLTDTVQTGVQFQYGVGGAAKFAGLKRRTGANGGEFVLFTEATEQIEYQTGTRNVVDTFGNPISSSINGEYITYSFSQPKKLKEYYLAAVGTSTLNKWSIVAANSNDGNTVWDIIDQRDLGMNGVNLNKLATSYSKYGGGAANDVELNGFVTGTGHIYNGNSRSAYQYFRIIFERFSASGEFKFAFAMKGYALDQYDVIQSGDGAFMTASLSTPSSGLSIGGTAQLGALNAPASVSESPSSNIQVTRDLTSLYNVSANYSGGLTVSSMKWTISNLIGSETYATIIAEGFNCASDMNLKKNIVTIENALDKLDGMRGVYHDWNDESNKEHAIGVIAQEVKAVYPELVREGNDGFLSVNYPKLTAVLLQAIKELKAIVMSK